jgi:hypothetical protein
LIAAAMCVSGTCAQGIVARNPNSDAGKQSSTTAANKKTKTKN